MTVCRRWMTSSCDLWSRGQLCAECRVGVGVSRGSAAAAGGRAVPGGSEAPVDVRAGRDDSVAGIHDGPLGLSQAERLCWREGYSNTESSVSSKLDVAGLCPAGSSPMVDRWVLRAGPSGSFIDAPL